MSEHDSLTDIDELETQEWLDAFSCVIAGDGKDRAAYLIARLQTLLASEGPVTGLPALQTDYVNTLSTDEQKVFPDDQKLFLSLLALLRWNAMVMVVRAGRIAPEIGGHIASYASIATLYEVGFNYFFRGNTKNCLGDLVYFQGHSSPGIYARAFLEGRITEKQLTRFRREVDGGGLSSYPHPWLMPDFWQFPTVSMGLGPLQGIYQARFTDYLVNRGLIADSDRKVWVFCGDGEMDEPESLGSITLAARAQLDRLIFVVNCNLQRLDGPVRGNGKIIQELDALFRGAGWHVIKVIWNSRYDELFAKDEKGLLRKRLLELCDGDYQRLNGYDGARLRTALFGDSPELMQMVADWSDESIEELGRGGHDVQQVYAAYAAAVAYRGKPVVILAKTVKGYGMGSIAEGQNIAHQQKKMSEEDLVRFGRLFDLPLGEEEMKQLKFCKPSSDHSVMRYLKERRDALGGHVPERQVINRALPIPACTVFESLLVGSGDRKISTTMSFVRILGILLRDKALKEHLVPIVPDESRTFGMEGLFRQIGIYSPLGQRYEPIDREQIMYYREAKDGQLLQEGINEAGGMCSWIAAATSYTNHNIPMIPMYIYYSMFGFQRMGDLAWAAADIRARGFLFGATSGRTTLAGEGLQHQDGHSHIFASLIPNCRAYDPTFSYELAVIIHHGLQEMFVDQKDYYYYITLLNENYTHPPIPKGAESGIIQGMYLFKQSKPNKKRHLQLLGCGAILREVIAAAELLQEDYQVTANIWSVTSFTELKRQALHIERYNHLHPSAKPKIDYVTQCLQNQAGPVVAATDYVRAFAEQIRRYVPSSYHVLGTDGFGRSDTSSKLRNFFEVDRYAIAYAAIKSLADRSLLPANCVQDALKRYHIDPKKLDPWCV